MTPRSRPQVSFGHREQSRAILNTILCVFLSLYVVVLVNLIAYRHPVRLDLTRDRIHSLSSETVARLGLVQEEIRVVFPRFIPVKGDPVALAEQQVLQRSRLLLNEFIAVQPAIDVVAEVDVFAEPDRWKQVCDTFHLAPSEWNRLIFCAGPDNSYRQSLLPKDLAVLGKVLGVSGAPPEVKDFRGESAMVGAIMRLVRRERRKVYFTQGCGEASLLPGPNEPLALAAFRRDLESQGFDCRELELTTSRDVPEDCDVLCIVGAEETLGERERDAVQRYLLRDGRLFVALGRNRTGLESVLERWGVEVGGSRVYTQSLTPGTRVQTAWVTVRQFDKAHPITRPFQNAPRFQVQMLAPRYLIPAGSEKRLSTTALLATGESTDEVRYYEGDATSDVTSRDDGYTVATATQQRPLARPPPGWRPRKTRVVVVGATNILRDPEEKATVRGGYLSASHRDFAMNSVHWLIGEEEQTALGERESRQEALRMDASIRGFLFLTSIVVFPGVFLVLGVFVFFLRRS